MSFVVIGLNHNTAPLDILEQVTVAPDALDKALHDLSLRPYVSEGVVLSTCNRTEVYILAERFHGAFQDVRDFLAQISFVGPEVLNDHLYTFYDDQAIEHLFNVSAGVDSAVLGEHEILGQIKRAWQAAQNQECVGMSLNAIFRAAVEVGKRVRTETSISRSIASGAALRECDVAFTSTAAPSLVIDVDLVEPLLVDRTTDLLILDVAMPRDVSAEVGDLTGVELYDLDSIGAFVNQGLASRAGEVDHAKQIIADEMVRHLSEVGKQSVSPLITTFRSHVETLRSEELARQAAKSDLSPEQQAAVDEATRAVLNKVMHEPTMRLKDSANSLRGERLAAALRELFDLS